MKKDIEAEFRVGEPVDLLDLAECLPDYFSPSLIEKLREVRAANHAPYKVRVTAVVPGKASDD